MQPDFLISTQSVLPGLIKPMNSSRRHSIRFAVDFLQARIREEAMMGDRDSALAMAGVLEVLHGLSKASDQLRRKAETDAYDFIAGYTDLISDAGADAEIFQGFTVVADVLRAVDIARKEESRTGQLCSYARVEELYEAMYAPLRY